MICMHTALSFISRPSPWSVGRRCLADRFDEVDGARRYNAGPHRRRIQPLAYSAAWLTCHCTRWRVEIGEYISIHKKLYVDFHIDRMSRSMTACCVLFLMNESLPFSHCCIYAEASLKMRHHLLCRRQKASQQTPSASVRHYCKEMYAPSWKVLPPLKRLCICLGLSVRLWEGLSYSKSCGTIFMILWGRLGLKKESIRFWRCVRALESHISCGDSHCYTWDFSTLVNLGGGSYSEIFLAS